MRIIKNDKCKVDKCEREYESSGFCGYHRTQFRRGIMDEDGSILRKRFKIPSNGRCLVDGCSRKHCASGFCGTHRYQFRMGIIDKKGITLKPLFDSVRSKIGGSNYERGRYYVLNRYFNGGPLCKCEACGGEFELYQMDGHHRDRSKKEMNSAVMRLYSFLKHPEMLAEMDSLQWLCCDCHIVLHAGGEDVPYAQTHKDRSGKYIDKAMLAILERKGHNCLDCGRSLGRRTAVFHHRDPSQKIACISQIAGRFSLDFVLAEVDKCDILCNLCHRTRHHNNKGLRGYRVEREQRLESPIGKKIRGRVGCVVEGCDGRHFGRGFCRKHLRQFNRKMWDEQGKRLRLPYGKILENQVLVA